MEEIMKEEKRELAKYALSLLLKVGTTAAATKRWRVEKEGLHQRLGVKKLKEVIDIHGNFKGPLA